MLFAHMSYLYAVAKFGPCQNWKWN